MRLSFHLKAGGLDLATAALMLGGAALIAGSIAAGAMVLTPPVLDPQPVATEAVPTMIAPGRASATLAADRVATVLFVDAATGAGSAARAGDRVDVLGYFSRQIVGSESVTRMLLQDVPVLTVERSGASIALTLAVPHDGALLLQEAQAIGGRPFVTLRSVTVGPDVAGGPRSYSDTDLAARLAGVH